MSLAATQPEMLTAVPSTLNTWLPAGPVAGRAPGGPTADHPHRERDERGHWAAHRRRQIPSRRPNVAPISPNHR
jgi:hypothetical protein